MALLSIEMLAILSIFFLALITVVFLIRDIFLLKNEELDKEVFAFAETYLNHTNTAVMSFITFFGSHEFIIDRLFSFFQKAQVVFYKNTGCCPE